MATSKTAAAAKDKAAAAQAEANGGPEPVMFRELELRLNPKLPLSVVARLSVLRDDDVMGAFRIMEAMLGKSEFQRVMDKLDADDVTIDDDSVASEIGELINDALGRYGMTPGEAEASTTS